MEKSKTSDRYSPEMRARAVRMVREHQGSYETQSAAVAAIAPKIGCIPETLRVWVRQAEKDSGARDGATSAERERIKEVEREVRQLRQAKPGGSCAARVRLLRAALSRASWLAWDCGALFAQRP